MWPDAEPYDAFQETALLPIAAIDFVRAFAKAQTSEHEILYIESVSANSSPPPSAKSLGFDLGQFESGYSKFSILLDSPDQTADLLAVRSKKQNAGYDLELLDRIEVFHIYELPRLE